MPSKPIHGGPPEARRYTSQRSLIVPSNPPRAVIAPPDPATKVRPLPAQTCRAKISARLPSVYGQTPELFHSSSFRELTSLRLS